MANEKITLAHGAGGKMSAALMRDVILPAFDNPVLDVLHDGAKLATSGARKVTKDAASESALAASRGELSDT